MTTTDSELVTTSLLKKNFPKRILETHCHRGDETVVIDRKDLLSICEFLRDDEGCSYEMLVDLTAVDLLEQNRTPRFEMVYHFKSLRHGKRIRVKVRLDEQDCSIDSIYHLWESSGLGMKGNASTCMGIHFNNHPDLRRILMYDQFEGHPLRKDYPMDRATAH